ncbi:Postreplication repair E3 ubiquitin-protein ligase rad18 [Tolypocladium ophioglossoides CBS 100239]|uniref:Postreplication repair E3 ubiquitin-protein ligase RAD18 n=1 Tax=Tolypocladium ophioglossoides (strain CBS 100239) TaxID=1163406 RepID=A0A0L0NBU8_TOLOC|nr:Postreplication repair E3 ubiquitin-protein ligase rad18 [Tolypocladium ophioglossoides CBS 100239]
MPVDDVPDSTDWLSTPLSGLAAVEAALRCQVCKDFYKTPMVTSCSHTFCSLCIRRALSNDGKCPLCRAPEQELKLRSNWSVEETAEAFSKARPAALHLARTALFGNRSPKRKADGQESLERHVALEPKRLRTSARLSKNRAEPTASPIALQLEKDIVEGSDGDGEYVPDDPDGLVPCPVCQRTMKAWQVFRHLEACPGSSSREEVSKSSNAASTFSQSQRRQDKTLERLPALSYPILKEQALRKKMTELGISNQGPRALLEKRHKEWITLWNANCDAARPKRRSELLQDLDIWERTQGGRAPTTGRTIQTAAAIKDKDFDATAWAAKHDSSFQDLIARAKKSREEAKRRVEDGGDKPSTAYQRAHMGMALSDAQSAGVSSSRRGDDAQSSGGSDGGTSPQQDPKAPAHLTAGSVASISAAMPPSRPDSDLPEPSCDALGVASAWGRVKHQNSPREWDVSGPLQQQTAYLDPDRKGG